MGPAGIRSFEDCVISRIEALNTIYANGVFGEVKSLQSIETTCLKNIIASKRRALQGLVVLLDFNVVAINKSQISQSTQK